MAGTSSPSNGSGPETSVIDVVATDTGLALGGYGSGVGGAPEPVAEAPAGWMASVARVFGDYRPSVVSGGWPTLPLLLIAGFAMFEQLDGSAYGTLIPEIQNYFGVSLTVLFTLTAITGLLPLFLSVPVGFLSDRLPRSKVIALGAAIWILFCFATPFASTVVIFAVFRMGSGIGHTTGTAQQSILADAYPPDRRPGVYGVHQVAMKIGALVGPSLAGFIGQYFGWQYAYLLFAMAATPFVLILAFGLKEPVRGAHERRLMGASEEVANEEERPPGWTEGWYIAKGVRTLRRIWLALPFLVGAIVVITPLMSLYYKNYFNASESEIGLIQTASVSCGALGILAGGSTGNRILRHSPSRLITYVGLLGALLSLNLLTIALVPWLWVSIAAHCLNGFAGGFLAPAMTALMSLTIPPRARSFALGFGALFVAMGFLISPFSGIISDHYGVRAGIVFMVPLLLIGTLIIASAGASVSADIRAATAASMASHEIRRSRQTGRTKLLVCRDLDVHYGSVQVLFNVDFDLEEGEIVALLGTNGAGKSTLLNALGGVVTPSNGAIFFDGEDITHLPSNEHLGKGMAMVPGGKGVFPTLSVAENLKLASWQPVEGESAGERMEKVYDFFPRLRERSDQAAGDLSGGEQQMLALGQAFLSRPRLLMIDELSLGLAPVVVDQLLQTLEQIHALGTTIVLVEQSVNVALMAAQRAVFMEKGEVKFTGPTADLLDRPDILRSVFLEGAGSYGSRRRKPLDSDGEADTVLQASDVTCRFGGVSALQGTNIALRKGEVVGIIGPNGAGKTTLFDVISGYVKPDEGRIEFLGEDISELTPDARARKGVGRSFQDALLFPSLTVNENLLVAVDRHRAESRGSRSLRGARSAEINRRKRVERLIYLLGLGDLRDKFVRELSTGQRRLVDLGCMLGTDPDVLLLDEPSSGIAQRETEELPGVISRIKFEADCSILIIEHDMDLIANVADELVAMELGQVLMRGSPEEVLHDSRVAAAYLGNSEGAIHRSGRTSIAKQP